MLNDISSKNVRSHEEESQRQGQVIEEIVTNLPFGGRQKEGFPSTVFVAQ